VELDLTTVMGPLLSTDLCSLLNELLSFKIPLPSTVSWKLYAACITSLHLLSQQHHVVLTACRSSSQVDRIIAAVMLAGGWRI
jgi:hypothetical protein